MALTACAPCDCISSNIPNDKFKQDIETILCDLLTAQTSLGTQAQFVTHTIAGATAGIPTTGVKLVTNSNASKQVTVNSTLDVATLVSLDGGVNYPYAVAATNGTLTVNLGQNGLYTAEDIWIKAVTSNSTSGSVTGIVVF